MFAYTNYAFKTSADLGVQISWPKLSEKIIKIEWYLENKKCSKSYRKIQT